MRIFEQNVQTAGGTVTRDGNIPALDGLRFMAALFVVAGHYSTMNVDALPLSDMLATLPYAGMTLFFVLSGFVIHYNYGTVIPRIGGVRSFFVARFARLYPLYIVLFLVDFTYTGLTARGACGRIDAPGGQWLGLFYYLTLTQSWFYTVYCNASLVYQYGPVAAVSWSISVEMFFYLAYVGLAVLIARRNWQPVAVIVLAGAAYALVVLFYLLCVHFTAAIDRVGVTAFGPVASAENDWGDSLLRYLLYFNPVIRLGEFLAGVAAAHLFLARGTAAREPAVLARQSHGLSRASMVTLATILALVILHLWIYSEIAPAHVAVGRFAAQLYTPLVALTIYLLARYPTPWSRLFALPLVVALGEASYSTYLLHEILPSAWKRLGLFSADPLHSWLLYAGSLVVLAIVSRISYLRFESPARSKLRRLLAPSR